MFGQPASSQTVTSRRSSVSVRSDWYSAPIWASIRNHSGLRERIGIPASGSTPALRSLRSSGRSPDVDEALRSTRATCALPPRRFSNSSPRRSSTSWVETLSPNELSDATGCSAIPHGTIASNPTRSISTLSATPCSVRRTPSSLRSVRVPIAAILYGVVVV